MILWLHACESNAEINALILFKHFNMKIWLLVAMTFILRTAYCQPGTLDKSFGHNGLVDPKYEYVYGVGRTVLIQDDGKIILVGQTFYTYNCLMVRYLKNGMIDSSFGINGIVSTTFAGGYSKGSPIAALQKDGKIVVVGIYPAFDNESPTISRYLPNGKIDSGFGVNGLVHKVFPSKRVFGEAIGIEPDGKIVIAGQVMNPDESYAVARCTVNGEIDTTYGNNTGRIQTTFSNNVNQAWTMTVQPDGKVIVGGRASVPTNDFALLRVTASGKIDSSFGEDGKVTTDFCNSEDQANSIAVQADGKIIVAGEVVCGSYYNYGLSRYLNNGHLDSSFGINGKVITDFNGYDDYATSVAIEPNGKIVVGGVSFSTFDPESGDFAIIQYKTNGEPDSTFGSNGKAVTDFHGRQDWAYSVALQKDGKIIVGGFAGTSDHTGFALARYYGDECIAANNCSNIKSLLKNNNITISSLKLFPDPVKTILTVSLKSPVAKPLQINISDIYGKLYKAISWNTYKGANIKELDVSFLKNGIYILKIVNDSAFLTLKFLKE